MASQELAQTFKMLSREEQLEALAAIAQSIAAESSAEDYISEVSLVFLQNLRPSAPGEPVSDRSGGGKRPLPAPDAGAAASAPRPCPPPAPGQLPSWIKIVGEPAEPPRAEADEDGYQLDGYDY